MGCGRASDKEIVGPCTSVLPSVLSSVLPAPGPTTRTTLLEGLFSRIDRGNGGTLIASLP